MRFRLPRTESVAVAALVLWGGAASASSRSGIELHVLDSHGTPVADARIEVLAPPVGLGALGTRAAFRAQATTDAQGTAVVAIPALERLLVLVDAEGSAPHSSVISGRDRSSRRLVLSPGREVLGVVRFEEPPPEKAGRVCVSWQGSFEEWTTNRDWRRCAELPTHGSFAVTGIQSGEELYLHAEAPGFLPTRLKVVEGKQPDAFLERGVLLRGTVASAVDRTAIAGALVADGAAGDNQVFADKAGAFEIALRPESREVLASAKHFRRLLHQLPVPLPTEPLVLELEPRASVTGVVVQPDPGPLPEAFLWFEHRTEDSRKSKKVALSLSEDGLFTADLPGAGEYTFGIRMEGLRAQPLGPLFVARGQQVDLGTVLLREGAVIAGMVASEATGEPVAGAEVLVFERGPGLMTTAGRGIARSVSADDGTFRVAGLPASAYQVRIRHADYALAIDEALFEEETNLDLGPIWLRRASELAGVVTDRRGRPRAGLAVELADVADSTPIPIARAQTDQEGRFEGLAVGPGKYRARVLGERLLASQIVEVESDRARTEVSLTTDGTDVSGVILRSGIPVAGGYLRVSSLHDPSPSRGKLVLSMGPHRTTYGLSQSSISVKVNEEGQFRIEDSPSGWLRATFTAPDGATVHRRLRVPAVAETSVRIEIEGLPLEGWVLDRESEAPVVASLDLVRSATGEPAGRVWADDGGRFLFKDLAPGAYSLRTMAEGYRGDHRKVIADLFTPPVEVRLSSESHGSLTISLLRTSGEPAAGAMVTLLDESGLMVRALPANAQGIREFSHLPAGQYFLVWTDGAGGTGVRGPIAVTDEARRIDYVMPSSAAVSLLCKLPECSGGPIDYLGIYSEQGIDLSPYLPGFFPSLSFSDGGESHLGQLSAGRYWLRLSVANRQWQRELNVVRGPVSVRLE